MRYTVKLCTKDGWTDLVHFEKDWRLKDWRKEENRNELVTSALEHFSLSEEHLVAWRIIV